ncbi:hypothetical protein FC093_00405 [Ilyomonas limi]|uniref:Lipoprotein n=1 Tax=Ilyomonas limi TaxID=2575867 RepID=A0A4U3L8X8_9BACT|nr:hypothetical protein [Ilyomonas limi]TKK71522.1 hypothetical protein FC093_00405 [Ilyomonas limi]
MKKLLCICLLFLLAACTSDNGEEKATPAASPHINKVNFFLEVSGSMAGYLNGATDFVKTIPNLLVAIEHKVDSGRLKVHEYYIADSITPFNGSTEEFISEMATRQTAKEKSSEMQNMFKMIADKTDSNDISMFVSDCILSYSDAEVKANKEINREKAEGGLKPLITSTFDKLQQKNNMCASVFGFMSDFNGTYYTYQNEKIPIKKGQVVRPYYLWVIGNRELLKQFNAQLYKLESFKPDLAINFGLFDKSITDYSIFFRYKKSGEWETDGKALTDVAVSKKQSVQVAVGLDLSALPPYAQDTSYLRQHLQLKTDNVDFTIANILLADDINKSDLKKNELDDLSNSTHLFIINIKDVYKPTAALQFSLPLQYDTSYRKLSIMDDRNVANISGKTFGFEYLVDGVRAAYQNPNQDFISIDIPIKK